MATEEMGDAAWFGFAAEPIGMSVQRVRAGCDFRHQEGVIVALKFPYRLAAAACLGMAGVAGASDGPWLLPASAVAASTDQQLADAIAQKLAEATNLSGYKVDVSCLAGRVELSGSVSSVQQKGEVSAVVANVRGVKKIDNKLSITATDVQPAQATEMIPGPAGVAPGGMPPGNMPPPGAFGGYGGMDPSPVFMPPTAGLYDSQPPKMPPYAWPTYAPYNNYSRVGYPCEYPANAFPYIGPFYPFPKVPLGFRAIKLEWEDGHWYYGRTATMRDYWKVRYW